MQAPQINHQTARHGYDGLFAHGSQGAGAFAQDGQTLLHRRILRLKAHHAPGALYQCGADPRITALGHAAWHGFQIARQTLTQSSACSRRRHAAESGSHGSSVRAFAAEALIVRLQSVAS